MKKLLALAVVGLLLFSHTMTAVAEPVSEPIVTKSETEIVQELVVKYSKEYKVSAKLMMETLRCENNTFDFDRQSELKYRKGNRWKQPAGSYERSFGVAQIHLPDNPDVSYAEATDPDFAIEFMAQKFAQGRATMWSCYKNKYA